MVSIQVVATPMMRPGDVRVREADGLEHAASGGAIRAVGQLGAVALVRIAGQVVGQGARRVGHGPISPRLDGRLRSVPSLGLVRRPMREAQGSGGRRPAPAESAAGEVARSCVAPLGGAVVHLRRRSALGTLGAGPQPPRDGVAGESVASHGLEQQPAAVVAASVRSPHVSDL